MSKVLISDTVNDKMMELRTYLSQDLKLSIETTKSRISRMRNFVKTLSNSYALCRFKKWRDLGYHCVVFEKNWIFAYEVFDKGIIVQDMAHTATLSD